MSLHTFTILEKIDAIAEEIKEARGARRSPGSSAQRHYEILKAISADLRARQELPRSNTLGELERALTRMQQSKTAEGYDRGQMESLANLLVNKWPFVRQSLEQFGEESAE